MIAGAWQALFRALGQPIVGVATRVFFGLHFVDAHFLPRSGPALIVSNHQGYLDPILLQTATARPIRYMMTSVFYDIPCARPFFWSVGAIRVPQGGPYRDAFRQAHRVLDSGGLVGIFPEGRLSRDGKIGEALPGAAFLAGRSGAPVIPARIEGSIRVLPHGEWLPRHAKVRIRFGEPLVIKRGRDPAAADRIWAAVDALDYSGSDS